jgi:flagellar biosynthesis protein FlhB
MAGQERTESATPRRRDEVRRRGQAARSSEIGPVAALLAGFMFLRYWGESLVLAMVDVMRGSFRNLAQPEMTVESVMAATQTFSLMMAVAVLPVFLLMICLGLASNFLQVGFLLTLKPLQPDFSRLNPLEGAKRLVSKRSLVELLKAIAKLAIVMFVVYQVLIGRLEMLLALPLIPFPTSIVLIVGMAFDAGIWAGAVLLLLAAVDYGYQRFAFEQQIKMSREEVREEFKQTEGNPVIRQRVRQLQRAAAQRRMMQAVPTADVVITNPTHFAIALQYDGKSMRAPRVIAKGQDLIAQQIKKVAAEHGVPMMENRPLAQALYKTCEIGQEIPGDLYAAVAEILAFVFRLRLRGGVRPVPVGAS